MKLFEDVFENKIEFVFLKRIRFFKQKEQEKRKHMIQEINIQEWGELNI